MKRLALVALDFAGAIPVALAVASFDAVHAFFGSFVDEMEMGMWSDDR